MNSLGLDKTPAETRVVAAMSGGVDSSVTAALLAEQGYDVIGITLQLYDYGAATARPGTCCAGQDIHDARRVAAQMGIPHYVLDFEDRFRGEVMDDFADSYLAGETPIPCVRCNQTVKFRDLVSRARDLQADVLATGHYVRRVEGAQGAELHRAADGSRDQSYFLFATTRDQLDFLRFPLGDMPKSETRAHAERFGLAVADKPDSQDICFVPDGNYAEVVKKMRPGAAEPGDIVDLDGAVLGRHEGILHYTVGQRRGLGIGGGEALYVVRLDPLNRRVIVGPKGSLMETEVSVRGLNWLGAPLDDKPQEVTVKLRSMHQAVPACIRSDGDGGALVTLFAAQAGVAPGQACVAYDGDRVLGGGWISKPSETAPAIGQSELDSLPASA